MLGIRRSHLSVAGLVVLTGFVFLLTHGEVCYADSSDCYATLSTEAKLNIPVLSFAGNYYQVGFQYSPSSDGLIWFTLADIAQTAQGGCGNPATIALNPDKYLLHIPSLALNGSSFWLDFEYAPTSDGLIWFKLSNYGINTGAPLTTKDFFPTSVGSTWSYAFAKSTGSLLSTALTSGDSPQIKTVHSNGSYNIQTYVWQNGALYLSSDIWYDKNGNKMLLFSITYTPPRLFLPATLEDGVHETAATKVNGGYTRNIDIRVVALPGTLSVPAGSFSNCMVIYEIDSFTNQSTGKPATDTFVRWIVPGVGIVQETLATDTQMLTGYSIK